MLTYAYKIDESDAARIDVKLYLEAKPLGHHIGSALILNMNAMPTFEAYGVNAAYQNQGLSAVLTHVMMLYCVDKAKDAAQVLNAHWPLNLSLRSLGFVETNARRDPTFRPPGLAVGANNTGDYTCNNLKAALTLSKAKLLRKGLIAAGLRNAGPYMWRI